MRTQITLSLALFFYSAGAAAVNPAFPSLEVLKVNRIATEVAGDLSKARAALAGQGTVRVCRYLGKVESGAGFLRGALNAIDTLFNGHLMSGNVAPPWLEELELAAISAQPIHALAVEAALACENSAPNVAVMDQLARELNAFQATWTPFRDQAMRELY